MENSWILSTEKYNAAEKCTAIYTHQHYMPPKYYTVKPVKRRQNHKDLKKKKNPF